MATLTLAPSAKRIDIENMLILQNISDEHLYSFFKGIQQEINRRSKKPIVPPENFLKNIVGKIDIKDEYFVHPANSISDHKIPRKIRQIDDLKTKSRYLPDLLDQDWSYLWSGGDPDKKYCVYVCSDPLAPSFKFGRKLGGRIPLPFFIGYLKEGLVWVPDENSSCALKVKNLIAAGVTKEKILTTLITGVSETQAIELEAKLVYFFGTVHDIGNKGILLNPKKHRVPDFKEEIPRKIKIKAEDSHHA